ncbi:DNA polymerase III [Candidatus Gottesmanbacteria bacterium]|nr:DNA polymerase III [Candidatus Gottesmanbacteria bacterium]
MTNKEVAVMLREVAAAFVIKNENRFRIIAYERAADSIEHQTQSVEELWKEGKIKEIPGIGPNIAQHLGELFTKGKVAHFENEKKGLPKAMFSLLNLPGFGAKKAFKLTRELNIKDSDDPFKKLKEAAQANKIASIEGFGEKSEQDILTSLESFQKKEAKLSRMLLPIAYDIATRVINYLKKSNSVIEIYPLGSLRRMVATVGDIDIAISSNQAEKVIEYFLKFPEVGKIIDKGKETTSVVLKNGVQVDIMVQPEIAFGALLQHFTGSKHHNIALREYALKKDLSLSEHGIKDLKRAKEQKSKEFSNEEVFYNFLGLDWIPPELREDTGEIEAAQKHNLPNLVELSDIKGDLHLHSNYDLKPSHDLGHNSFLEILNKATELKYEYIAFSEHNPKQSGHNISDIIDIIKRRKQTIDKINYSLKSDRVHFFNMMETDILPNGYLALPKQTFEYIDATIISIHSSFDQSSSDMTKRILKALSYSKVKIFGHPTGRLIERREGVNANWFEIFNFCKAKNIALEINANPNRLDLPDMLVREAVKNGNKFVIDTDAHQINEMNLMRFGVSVARRGWLEKNDILNTLPYSEFKKWLLNL